MQNKTPDHILAAHNGKQRGCIDPTHTKKEILFICLQPQCKKSRLICSQCIQQNTHEHQNNWIEFDELIAMNLNVKETKSGIQNVGNWPQNKTIRAIFYNSVMAEEGNPDLILMEQVLDDFLENVRHQVGQIKKDIKDNIILQQQSQKETFEYFKNMIGASFDLTPVQEQVHKFKNFQINIQELNQNISQFAKESKEKEHDILQDYRKQIRDKKLKELNVKAIQNSLQIIQKDIEQLRQKALTSITYGDLEFEGWTKKQVKVTDGNIYQIKGQTYNIMRSKQTFDRQQNYTFRFKLIDYTASYLYFGLAPLNQTFQNQQYFWFQGGPQLCLKSQGQRQGTFETEGNDITQVFDSNQTYEVTFCVDEKLFKVQDEDSKSIMTYTGVWDSCKEWKLVIGPNQNTRIQIQAL